LQTQAKVLAREATVIYELMKEHGPSELIVVNSLPHPDLVLIQPISLTLVPVKGVRWRAALRELALSGNAADRDAAVRVVLRRLASTYLTLEQEPSADPEAWQIVQQLVRRTGPRLAAPKPAAPVPQHDHEHQAAPTLAEWQEANAPRGESGVVIAWRTGASARFHGRRKSRYKDLLYVTSWWSGHAAMESYLAGGGLIACQLCNQPWAGEGQDEE
jgi:hypothetical protein